MEFWLKVAGILVPSVITLVVPFITYKWITKKLVNYQDGLNMKMADYQADLNRRLEDHKKDISKELKVHELQIQSMFQTRFYEFQTRYSWLHQKRAEAIEKLYAMLAGIENDLVCWVSSPHGIRNQMEEELYRIGEEHLQEMINFFDEKTIYFNQEISDAVNGVVESARAIYEHYPTVETSGPRPLLDIDIKQQATKLKAEKIGPLMALLEDRFRKLLEAEIPISAVERPAIGPDSTPPPRQLDR
jgi:hypothetical protein